MAETLTFPKCFYADVEKLGWVDYEKDFFTMTIKVKNITLNEGGKNTIQIFFWSFFSFIRTADGDVRIKSLYSVRIHESKDQRKLCIWTLLMQFGNKVLIAVISSLQLSTKKHIGFDFSCQSVIMESVSTNVSLVSSWVAKQPIIW